uniref:Uncharacterized protein n=1 Tax=Lotharella oceanica TaxID=641309 RepID=A0A7S2XCQ5_9EUKA
MHDSKVAKIFEGNLARQEARVLEANEFTLWVEHPYKFFFALLREMLLSGSGHARTKALGKQGYNLITDSFSTNLCIHYSPQEIATAVLHMLTKHHRITMAPLPISPFIPWYMALCEEVFLNFRDKKVLKCLLFQLSEEDLENISSTIVSHSNSNIAKDISAAKKAALDNLEAPPSVTPPLPPAVPLPPAPPPPPPTPPITSDRLLGNKGMDSKHDQRRHTSVPPPPTFHAPVRNQPYAYSSARHAHAYSSASQAHAYSSTTRVYTPERHQSRATNGGHRIQQPWPPGVYHAAGYPSLNGRPNQHMGTVGAGAKRRADGMNPYASRGMPSASTFDRGTRQRASSSKRTKLISGTADARSRGKISSGRRNQYYA